MLQSVHVDILSKMQNYLNKQTLYNILKVRIHVGCKVTDIL